MQNRDKARDREISRRWRDRHPEKHKASIAAYYRRNAEHIKQRSRDRHAALRREIIEAYGGECACCGETRWQFLAIDHVKNNGAEERRAGKAGYTLYQWLKTHGFPKDDYRLLCHNCNVARAMYGQCPHLEQVQ